MVLSLQSMSVAAFCEPVKDSSDFNIEVERVRRQFPLLQKNRDKIFFDNASTVQKPSAVIETVNNFNELQCSNAGRGSYSWSTRMAAAVEETRERLAKFFNTNGSQIAFTNGATDSLNLVAQCWGLHNLKDGDEVMVCLEDHRSSVLPWLNLKELLVRFGININIVPFLIHPSGTYDRKSICEALSSKTRLISLSHIHHVYGMEMDIVEIKKSIPDSVLISLDASQSAGHIEIDFDEIGVDFISLAGHKMFAANGVGLLWASPRAIEDTWPIRVGAKTNVSERCERLVLDRSSMAGIFECGTLNLPAILSFSTAIEFIESIGRRALEAHISALTKNLVSRLKTIPGIEFAPGIGICDCTKGYGIVSFKFSTAKVADVGAYLDSENIFVRTGDHCLGRVQSDDEEYMRVSLQIYNGMDDVARFIEVLEDVCC